MIGTALATLTSPPVLGFGLGGLAVALGTDLRLPLAVTSLLSTYLLLAIGLKGGVALTGDASGLVVPAIAGILLALLIPIVAVWVLRRAVGFGPTDAAAVAAHYGSVSVVTFTASLAAADAAGLTVEGYLPALVALLEIPGIVVALALAARGSTGTLRRAVHEAVTAKSAVLLAGGLIVGAVAGADGMEPVKPLFVDLFPGLLVLYLLDLGAQTVRQVPELRRVGGRLVAFGLVAPIVLGTVGVLVGTAAGLGIGGTAVFATLIASASYIAAPAAVSVALPEANLAAALAAALGVTFPFNLLVGIPLYQQLALLVG